MTTACVYFVCNRSRDSIGIVFYATVVERGTIANCCTCTCDSSHQKNHVHGIKGPCLLNNLPRYHLVTNYSLDIMHILLEGVVPVELGCGLAHSALSGTFSH